jgi:TolA-binding protein
MAAARSGAESHAVATALGGAASHAIATARRAVNPPLARTRSDAVGSPDRGASAVESTAPPASAAVPAAPDLSAAPPAAAPDSAAAAEATAYARAHRLHFDGGDPGAALAAWNEYLDRFPSGTFAPDARYNRAIDLLKLRRTAEARAALQPFASGAFAGYHQNDARELLRSLR